MLIKNHFNINSEQLNIPCVQLKYPFGILLYHSGNIVYDIQTLYSEDAFVNLINSLPADASISISYPIKTINANGEKVSINNNELKASLLSCENQYNRWQAGQYFNPNDHQSSHPCSLFVIYNTGDNALNQYTGGYFVIHPDYTVSFNYNRTTTYRGSWIIAFVEEEIQININLEGNDNVSQYWNHSYKYVLTNNQDIYLKAENSNIRLQRTCPNEDVFAVGSRGPLAVLFFTTKVSILKAGATMRFPR